MYGNYRANKDGVENSTDRSNELIIASLLEHLWQCKMEKQPKFSTFDFMALKGDVGSFKDRQIKAFVEIRCLNNRLKQYPYIFINLKKLIEARMIEATTDTACLYVVQFIDVLAYCRLNKKLALIKGCHGWKRRTGPNDNDELGLIPIKEFKIITDQATDGVVHQTSTQARQ